MSGNINDTNIERVRKDVENMLNDIRGNDIRGNDIRGNDIRGNVSNVDVAEMEYKYRYLYKTSKTLFNFILKKVNDSESFDDEYFRKTINFMLQQIQDIQQSSTSQYDASANVSYHLAKKYIPQYKNKN